MWTFGIVSLVDVVVGGSAVAEGEGGAGVDGTVVVGDGPRVTVAGAKWMVGVFGGDRTSVTVGSRVDVGKCSVG